MGAFPRKIRAVLNGAATTSSRGLVGREPRKGTTQRELHVLVREAPPATVGVHRGAILTAGKPFDA